MGGFVGWEVGDAASAKARIGLKRWSRELHGGDAGPRLPAFLSSFINKPVCMRPTSTHLAASKVLISVVPCLTGGNDDWLAYC